MAGDLKELSRHLLHESRRLIEDSTLHCRVHPVGSLLAPLKNMFACAPGRTPRKICMDWHRNHVTQTTVTWVEADVAGLFMMHVSCMKRLSAKAHGHGWLHDPHPPSLGLRVVCWQWCCSLPPSLAVLVSGSHCEVEKVGCK